MSAANDSAEDRREDEETRKGARRTRQDMPVSESGGCGLVLSYSWRVMDQGTVCAGELCIEKKMDRRAASGAARGGLEKAKEEERNECRRRAARATVGIQLADAEARLRTPRGFRSRDTPRKRMAREEETGVAHGRTRGIAI